MSRGDMMGSLASPVFYSHLSLIHPSSHAGFTEHSCPRAFAFAVLCPRDCSAPCCQLSLISPSSPQSFVPLGLQFPVTMRATIRLTFSTVPVAVCSLVFLHENINPMGASVCLRGLAQKGHVIDIHGASFTQQSPSEHPSQVRL